MTTVTQAEIGAENPKTIDLNLVTSPTTVDSESNIKSDDLAKATNGETVTTDVHKKMKRAERFGTPVNLSESEKRNSRAERFGIGSTGNGSDSTKQAEELKKKKKAREERFGTATTKNGSDATKEADELKKKARAERFGIVKTDPADEEVKKKARISKFGSSTNNDPIDDEKKKARAIRFSDQGAGKKSNSNENIEVKATDTVKADGAT